MFSEYNGEKENIKNYNGRQLLEMIQNADDAASKAKGKKKVMVRLQGNKLIIANTGHPFSEEGLNSIFHSHLSPKQAMEDQIGKKGLGFRSILSWAERIIIHSHELHVAFSEHYSKIILDELLEDANFRLKYASLNKKKLPQPISTLVCPEILASKALPEQSDYDTIIEIELLPEAEHEVRAQMKNDLDGEILLFLNNLEELILEVEDKTKVFNRKQDNNDIIIETTKPSGNVKEALWKIHSLSGKFEDESPYELSIAWCDDLSHSKDMVYSFFRTKVPILCSGILHGTFELNADRNLIIDDPLGYNKKLLSLLPELLAGAALRIAGEGQPSYAPLEFLSVDIRGLDHVLKQETIRKRILKEAKSVAIFPTTANTYIHWDESSVPVYFDETLFSDYLDPVVFPDILLPCQNQKALAILEELNYTYYKVESIVKDISPRMASIPVADYAGIIVATLSYFDKDTDLSGLSFFYGTGFAPLTFDKPIFIPDNQKKFSLPAELGIQIISKDLAAELMAQLNVADSKSLIQGLPDYNLKEYSFEELAEMLITHYAEYKTKDKIIELHTHLYSLYSAYGTSQQHWEGSPCPILSKKGSIVMATKAYLGHEYGYVLTDALYSYDRSKIAAGPKKFMTPESHFEKWKKYMLWLGIATKPKIQRQYAGESYADHVMKSYNFPAFVDDYHFKTYAAFRKELTGGYGRIIASGIDDLEKVLLGNTPERILQWIANDNDLTQLLEKDTEPENGSIYFNFYKIRADRKIDHSKMKSYIRWQIANTKWLRCEQGFREAPSRCTVAAYVNEDFHGLVEKPSLDYDLLKGYGISRDKADYLLTIIGVHKTVTSFSTEMLFSMLLKLPELENREKKARTIYNQLSANYDDKLLDRIDTEDAAYKKFIAEGQVLCKDGEFVTASDCRYVNDKRYGETILREFNIIDIDRRRGKDKIRRLFGVQPLENLQLEIMGTPDPHPLATAFAFEIESFKPYVYVLRREVDGGTERKTIKEIRFSMVSSLSLQMEKHEISLADYEYFYDRARLTVYICCPDYSNLNELREDVQFCSAVAESFSAVLDVDSQRQLIRELFSKSGNSRDEILRAEIDDQQLEKLALARNVLGVISNPKLDFWKSFSRCFSTKGLQPKNDTDEELLAVINKAFPKFTAAITAAYGEINYDELGDEHNAQLVVDLFSAVGLTISKFNMVHYPQIDLQPLYKQYFRQELMALSGAFALAHHKECIAQPGLRSSFMERLHQFMALEAVPQNEITYKAHANTELGRLIKEAFNMDSANLIPGTTNTLATLKADNLKDFFTTNPSVNQQLFTQFMGENPTMDSLLYFSAELSLIAQKYAEWTGSRTDGSKNSGTGSKRLKVGDTNLLYNTYSDLKDQIDELMGSDGYKNITSKNIKTNSIETKKKNKGTRGASGVAKPKVPKEDIGFLGEYLVYQHLQQTIDDKESIKWVSEYAKQCGNNICGMDGLGYDIEYIPNGAKYPRFVEVKVVSVWEDAFHITSPEVRFGETKKKNYEIFLIKNASDPSNAKIERIQGLFDYGGKASFSDNNRFSVINDNYIIKFKKV